MGLDQGREHHRHIMFDNLQDGMLILWVALRIMLIITISVASGERSFSRQKLIKVHLWSSRLNSLTKLSTENDLVKICRSRKVF